MKTSTIDADADAEKAVSSSEARNHIRRDMYIFSLLDVVVDMWLLRCAEHINTCWHNINLFKL